LQSDDHPLWFFKEHGLTHIKTDLFGLGACMKSQGSENPDLLYPLDSKPPVMESTFAALQHVLASFVGIITPTLIIGGVLGLGEHIPYLISMALIVSGVGTFIQARRPMGVGAGMVCVQGTSFAFLSSVLAAGFIAKGKGGGPEEILALIMGVCFLGAFVEIVLSQFIDKLRRIVTPLVTGIVITIIGASLIKVGVTDLAGGFKAPDFGSAANLALGGFVLLTIIVLNRSSNQWIRLSSIIIGLVAGQYLSISVQPSHSPYTEIRQYSLSDAPNARSYRISVRREDRGHGAPAGVVSCYLHDEIKEGDVIEAYAPAGDFVFKASPKPLVLISAGVGLTPMQSILESLAQKTSAETGSANGTSIYYLHATESQDTHAFKARTEALKGNLALTTYTWYRRAQNETSEYRFEGEMRLSDAPNLPLQQAEIYLCGPIGFMKAVYQQLKAHGVDDSQIHYELFGPHQSLEA
jgi:ferredoxin-NADP reductase